VSATPNRSDGTRPLDPRAPILGEPLVHFVKTPGQVEIAVRDLEALLDRAATPSYPHAAPALNSTVTQFLIDSAREDRRSAEIAIGVAVQDVPWRTEDESGIRAKFASFFANEAEMVALGQRVNSTEAWGSLRYAIPVVALAAFVAGLLTNPSTLGVPSDVSQLGYLVVVVVIWVMVWDPIEKLLFDSYFIRLRIRALQKLARASVSFVYRPPTATPPAPDTTDPSTLDSIRDIIEG
jgi:hypothetical protein